MTPEVLEVVFWSWLRAFLFTLAVEVPIFVLMVRGEVPAWRAALAGAAGTCVTHPALWFLWSQIIADYTLYIVTGEALVASIEAASFFVLARPSSFWTAIAASFLANGASYGLGLLVG